MRGRWLPPALRVRSFRWYWLAQWPVLLGTWMQIVALGYLVFQTTHSTAAVGLVAAADGIPAVALSLLGGVLADRMSRRRILIGTQAVLGASSATLALLAATGHASLGAIVAIAVVFGAADAVDLPTRQALVADLVDRELVMGAVALGSVTMSATRIVGPSAGGLLIAAAGPGACFAVLAAAYAVPLATLVTVIPDLPPVPDPERSSPLREAGRGLRAAWRDPLVRRLLLCAGVLSLLGVSYMPYLPVLSATRFGNDASVLGLFYSTGGAGGLAAGLLLSTLGTGSWRARLLPIGGAVYAASLFTLAHSSALVTALPALVGISFGFLALNTSMTTLIQTEGDPRVRGRLLGIYTMLFAGLQPVGTLVYGVVGHAVALFDAIGVGGLVVGAVALLVSGTLMRGRAGAAPRAATTVE